jgi:transposase-like protein
MKNKTELLKNNKVYNLPNIIIRRVKLMKRDFILIVFGMFFVGVVGFIQYAINPLNWVSISALFNLTSLWVSLLLVVILIVLILIVTKLAFVEIKKIDDKKDNKELERHNEILSAIKDLVGDTWVADETVLKIGGRNIWCIDIIDSETRYLLATKLSSNRSIEDIKTLLEKAKDKANKTPKKILTDGWKGYLDGIELTFGSDAKHIQTEPFNEGDNTELIERWHGTLKGRTKTLRGLKNFETANQFLDGYLIYYNYLRPHESLEGKTPAEKANIKYQSKSWIDITRMADPQIEVLTTPAKVSILSEQKPLVRPISHRKYDIDNKRKIRKSRRLKYKRTKKIEKPKDTFGIYYLGHRIDPNFKSIL